MAYHALTDQFRTFFGRLNPSPSFERRASSEHTAVRALIENRHGPASALAPTCFLQGSYRQQTAIYTINDVDIIALCHLWYPGQPGGGPGWTRDQIFATIAAPLLGHWQYKDKVRYDATSMCIKIDLDIKLEILPVVYRSGTSDPSAEPFILFRPESGQWEEGYARYHQGWLSVKNAAARTGQNFIPMVKVLKHLRSRYAIGAVSFHLECLLYSLPDELFRGSPADYIARTLSYIAALPVGIWSSQRLPTPCEERDIFRPSEWTYESWQDFHALVSRLAPIAWQAATATDHSQAITLWQLLLGDTFFPRMVSR